MRVDSPICGAADGRPVRLTASELALFIEGCTLVLGRAHLELGGTAPASRSSDFSPAGTS